MPDHAHYCGCGKSWPCDNEGCTEDDVCRACAEREEFEEWEEAYAREIAVREDEP